MKSSVSAKRLMYISFHLILTGILKAGKKGISLANWETKGQKT